jgi:glycosyltransferase involved in cell wall biosynthesis
MPVYNEADSIECTLAELYDEVVSKTGNIDVFLSEDGSTDHTKEILLSLQDKFDRLHVQTFPERKGYPRATREALLAIESKYDYILFMDSDGQYKPNDFYALWRERFEADFIVGRRISRVETNYRRFLSRGLNRISRTLFHVTIGDLTSAFRLMKREFAQTVAEQVKYSKHNFWSEFTARSAVLKISTVEVNVSYRARTGSSKVYSFRKMPKVIWNEFSALLRIWAQGHLKGIHQSQN